MTMPPSSSSTRYRPVLRGQVDLAGQPAGQRQADAGESHRSDDDAEHGEQPVRRQRVPAESERDGDQHRELDDLDGDHRADLGGDQSRPPQRCRAQTLEHVIAAFEPGADPEADHRRAHRRQGEDARSEEVDRFLRVRSASTSTRLKNTSSSTGMPSVNSNCSPLPATRRSSARSCTSANLHG